jgi:hypothetical protein
VKPQPIPAPQPAPVRTPQPKPHGHPELETRIQKLEGDVGSIKTDMVSVKSDLVSIKSTLMTINTSVTNIANRLSVIEGKPQPPPPEQETHVVIVADQKASYWQRLGQEVENARAYYSAIRVAPPPSFSIPLPQLVLYRDGVPIYRSSGLRDVSTDLQRMVRGEFDPVSKS